MSKTLDFPIQVKHEAAERCPDFDEDCENIDHVRCWSGIGGTVEPFPGYCPCVFGMLP